MLRAFMIFIRNNQKSMFIGVNKLSWFHISAKNFTLTIPTDRGTFGVTYT